MLPAGPSRPLCQGHRDAQGVHEAHVPIELLRGFQVNHGGVSGHARSVGLLSRETTGRICKTDGEECDTECPS